MQTLTQPSDAFSRVAEFCGETDFAAIPDAVADFAALCILDLIGVAAAATQLHVTGIAQDHAARHWAAGEQGPGAKMLFDGRIVSLPGCAFALATQIDNLDAHDGWQPSKGHAGAALFPALASLAQASAISGREALAAMVIGYEVAYRAAVSLHATVPDYHTSGAWNALGCVATGARIRRVEENVLRHALGIAEYHAPRSQMMREIANPTMLHDGSGWGAPMGIHALLLAEDGFTGAPAATVEFDDAAFAWDDLGRRWLTTEQYIKPYPICRWAHAPIDAALRLRDAHDLAPEMIASVEIATFAESAALNRDVPTTTSNAQYSLCWPVAAALVRGQVTVAEVLESSFSDPALRAMCARIAVRTDPELDAAFPDQRLASLTIGLTDGRILRSGCMAASGGPDPMPTRDEIVTKFQRFAGPVLGAPRTAAIAETALSLGASGVMFSDLLDLLYAPARQ